MQVPLLDLKLQYKTIKSEIDSAINRVVESQHFILGPEVKDLEEKISQYLNVKHAFGVSSGTDALLAALMACDIHSNDEVIVPTYSFFSTAGVVSRLGAKPVFTDIDPVTYNMDPDDFRKRITKNTKAAIPVHLYGQSAEMDEICKAASENNIKVIEDAAQAIGTQYKDGRMIGSLGDVGCFSFFPSKNLGCFGDGGMVVTKNDNLAEKLKVMRVHGARPKYFHKMIGGNFRLDAIQAAILKVKLGYLNSWTSKRQANADLYTDLFKKCGLAQEEGKIEFNSDNRVLLPKPVYRDSGHKNYHIYNQYVIRVPKRDGLKNYLKERSIGSEIYYPMPFHRQECFAGLNCKDEDYPYANRACAESLALPIYPELTEEQIKYVVDVIKIFMEENKS